MRFQLRESKKPNIVLIVIDAARADHFSCYGYSQETTPCIDAIGREGVVYERAFSPGIWTLPSITSLFTGLYLSQHRTNLNHPYLDGQFLTLAEFLQRQGYRTTGFSSSPWVSKSTGLSRGFDKFRLVGSLPSDFIPAKKVQAIANRLYWNIFQFYFNDFGAKRINREVKCWFKKNWNEKAPFFLFLQYIEPHFPYRRSRAFKKILNLKDIALSRKMEKFRDIEGYLVGKVDLAEEDFVMLRGLYDEAIRYLDERIGDLFQMIEETTELNNTIIVIVSDHGECIGDHGLLGHQYCLYDSLIRVPMIIRYPSLFPSGERVFHLVQTNDLFPTIMDILGISSDQPPGDVQIKSLLFNHPDKKPRKFIFSEHLTPFAHLLRRRDPGFDPSLYDRRLQAVRTERYKYIWSSDGRDELYDVRDDPGELNNLIDSELKVSQTMGYVLDRWRDSVKAVDSQKESTPVFDEIVMEKLKWLGYL